MRSPENRPTLRRRILNASAGTVVLLGGIGASIGASHDFNTNQIPAHKIYLEAEEELEKGELDESELPRDPQYERMLDFMVQIVLTPPIIVLGGHLLLS